MMTNRFFIYKWIIKNNWEKKKKDTFSGSPVGKMVGLSTFRAKTQQ